MSNSVFTWYFNLQVLSEVRPEKFGWLLRNYDEVYTTLDFVLQQYYLRKYCEYYTITSYSVYVTSSAKTCLMEEQIS